MAAAALTLASSCQRELQPVSGNKGPVEVTYRIATDVVTRAAVETGKGAAAKNLIVAVYDENGENEYAELRQDLTVSGYPTNVTLTLVKDQKYKILFLAQADGTYINETSTDPKAIAIPAGATSSENYDIFTAVDDITVDGTAKSVTLKRPFSRVNFATSASSIAAAEAAGLTLSTAQISFTGIPKTFNALEGTVSGSQDVTLAAVNLTVEDLETLKDDYKILAYAYLPAEADPYLANAILRINSDERTLNISNLPLRANYRTNIIGDLLTSATNYNVNLNPDFDDEVDNVAQIGSNFYFTLAEAIAAVPTDGTKTTITMTADETVNVDQSALVVAAGKNIVLELNGHSIVGTSESGTTTALITNRGTLTIQDSSDTEKNGSGNGKLMSGATTTWTWDGTDDYSGSYASNNIRNDGTLIIESGLIYNMSTGSAAYAVDNYGAASLTVNGGNLDAAKASAIRLFYQNGGSVTVNDGIIGHYTSDTDYSYMGIQVMSAGTNGVNVTVNGGVITGYYSFYAGSGSAWSSSHFTITGGKFEGPVGFTGSIAAESLSLTGGEFHDFTGSYGDVKFITGGKFTADAKDSSEDYLADGYEFVDTGDGFWTVQIGTSWDGSIVEPSLAADGFYHITTASELAGIAQMVNAGTTFSGKTVILDADLNLGNKPWTPIGNSAKFFMGTFDGNGKTISNMSTKSGDTYAGLFGKINISAAVTIKNLTIKNATLNPASNGSEEISAGALIGWTENHSSYNLLIQNIIVDGVTVNSTKYVGGLIGWAGSGAGMEYFVIDGCEVKNSTIKSAYTEDGGANYKGHAGGVVGYLQDGTIKNTTVSDSKIEYTNAPASPRAGALAGTAQAKAVIGTGNKIVNFYINDTKVTQTSQVIGAVDARNDKTTDVTIE